MAKRVYYGTCKSTSGESEKKVIVPDLDIIEEDFQFEEGDLLVVFFAHGNTVSEPTIVVYVSDTEVEISTTSDEGKYIKTLDVEAGLEDSWQAGETIIFAYTQQDTSDVYYWELIDAAHATTEEYGNTKLFKITEDETFVNSLRDDNDWPDDVAMTPYMLKRFYQILITAQSKKDEEEEDEGGDEGGDEGEQEKEKDNISLGLMWKSADFGALETQPLGTLSFGVDGSQVIIDYPVQQVIQEYITTNPLVTHTGELYNNGNGSIESPTDESAEPFITRMVPNNLYFNNGNGLYYNNGSSLVPKIILNDSNNKLFLDGTSAIVLNKPIEVSGNATIGGNLVTTGTITANNGKEIATTGNLRGGTIFEGGTSLINKYSKMLKIVVKNTGQLTIAKNGYSSNNCYVNTEPGWKPMGVLGYNITNWPSTGRNASFCLPFAMMFYNDTNNPYIKYEIRNINSNNSAIVYVQFQVLYIKS